MRQTGSITLLILLLATSLAQAGEHRSAKARNEFKREQPCPSTGQPRGPCPGWIIDHIQPLACGGADDPSNMQWQTRRQAKLKDRWERSGSECKTTRRDRRWF
jgi:hypothetical protein